MTTNNDDTTTTTATAKKKRRRPRGWLLIEVAFGGVMASVILGELLVHAGDAMDRTTVVGRELTAQSLCQQAIEQARGIKDPVVNLADATNADVPIVAYSTSGLFLNGTYTRKETITTGTSTVNGLAVPFKNVIVTVTFPTVDGQTKSVTMETRVF